MNTEKATEIAAQIGRTLTPAQVAGHWVETIEGGEYYNRPNTKETTRKQLSRQAKQQARLTEDADAWTEGLALAGAVIADPINKHAGSAGGVQVAAMILGAMNVATMSGSAYAMTPGGAVTYTIKAVRP